MRECILDGASVHDWNDLYDLFATALDFPEWFGRNLDALYDCLTDVSEPTLIRFEHRAEMNEALGEKAAILWRVLFICAQDNPNLILDVA